MIDRGKQFWMENMFRPVFELKQAQIWFVGGFITLFTGGLALDTSVPIHVILFGYMMIQSGIRVKQGLPLLKRQFKLFVNYFYVISALEFRERNLKKKDVAFLGRGFSWGQNTLNVRIRLCLCPLITLRLSYLESLDHLVRSTKKQHES